MVSQARISINNGKAGNVSADSPSRRGLQGADRHANVIRFPLAASVKDAPTAVNSPGWDGCDQPGKGPVTIFVSAATAVALLGLLGHMAGLL